MKSSWRNSVVKERLRNKLFLRPNTLQNWKTRRRHKNPLHDSKRSFKSHKRKKSKPGKKNKLEKGNCKSRRKRLRGRRHGKSKGWKRFNWSHCSWNKHTSCSTSGLHRCQAVGKQPRCIKKTRKL
eukprot:PhF_6_TR16966/c1_g1_i1/m.25621